MLVFVSMALPTGLVVTLITAMFLNSKIKGQAIYRTIIFMPSIIPAVASAMVWLWLLNGQLGLVNTILSHLFAPINYVLGGLHISPLEPPNWLTEAKWAIPSLVMMSVWSAGNTVIIYLAGLQDVPRELYEAAELDGAGVIGKTLHVTLPSISPVIFFNLIMGIIYLLQEFMRPYIMTLGGPARATYFPTMEIYDNAFSFLKMGTASALAWIMFLVILTLTGLAFWTSRKWVHYQGD
jgi:multiple sugar transport system permease protein